MRVVVTDRISALTGTLSDARGRKITDATVVLFADDAQKWGPMTRYVRTARPDQDGRYRVQGLPPGRYLAVVLDQIEPGEEGNPELLAQLATGAASVVIRQGAAHTLDLRMSRP